MQDGGVAAPGLCLKNPCALEAEVWFATSRLRNSLIGAKIRSCIESGACFLTLEDGNGRRFAGLLYSTYEGSWGAANEHSPGQIRGKSRGAGCRVLAVLALAVDESVERCGESTPAPINFEVVLTTRSAS